MTIGLTRASGSPKYANYHRWLSSKGDHTIQEVDLFVEDLDEWLPKLDAIIFSGGGDIDPALYGMEEAREVCTGIDPERDRREALIFDYAREHKIPILGICRGLQFVVVHLGGTMVPHIPDDEESHDYHAKIDGEDHAHITLVESGSLLFRAVGELEGMVSSSHHQAVREVPGELSITARSPDGIVEAVEWREPEKNGYMLAVQWHPERMDFDSPFSSGLRDSFLLEVESSMVLKRSSKPVPKGESELDIDEIRAREAEESKGGDGTFDLPIIN